MSRKKYLAKTKTSNERKSLKGSLNHLQFLLSQIRQNFLLKNVIQVVKILKYLILNKMFCNFAVLKRMCFVSANVKVIHI